MNSIYGNEATNKNLVWIVNNNKQATDEYTDVFCDFQVKLIESESIGNRFGNGEKPGLIVVSARQSAGESGGFFLIKQIRKIYEISSVPILMLSADSDTIEEAESLRRGADEYLFEPLSPLLVAVKMKRLMAQYEELNAAVKKGAVTWKSLLNMANENISQCSVAVVDDEIKHREILEFSLRRQFSITNFNSGADALKAIENGEFSLVILDIKMPNMDGYEVIQAMHERCLIENTPVIFGTGKTRVKQIVKGLEKGAIDYLQKPYVPELVSARINMQLKKAIKLKIVRDALGAQIGAV